MDKYNENEINFAMEEMLCIEIQKMTHLYLNAKTFKRLI